MSEMKSGDRPLDREKTNGSRGEERGSEGAEGCGRET